MDTLKNTPATDRIQAPCQFYKQCGGCDFQHMTYTHQLQKKKDLLKELLLNSDTPILADSVQNCLTVLIPAPKQFHYRQRIRLQVDDNQTLGFHKRRSHTCVAIDSCLLAAPEINACLKSLLAQRSFDNLLQHTETLEILLNPEQSVLSIIIHFKRKPRPADTQHAQNLIVAIANLKNIFFSGDGFAVTGHDSLSFTLPRFADHTSRPFQLSLETGGFCQVNVDQNTNLVKTVLDFCDITAEENVLDLFCGMGNFSIPLAEKAHSVLGIEGQGSAIRSAKKNSIHAKQKNTTFTKKPTHTACLTLAKEGEKFDCIVLDPPRQGAPGLARILSALCTKRLIYISCDPKTLCRDLSELLQHGFELKKLQPIDMFPQTHHIETVALLEKS